MRKKLTAAGLGLATTVALVAGMGGSVALANDDTAPLDAPAIETLAEIHAGDDSANLAEVPETAAVETLAGTVAAQSDAPTAIADAMQEPTFTAEILQNPLRLSVSDISVPGTPWNEIKSCSALVWWHGLGGGSNKIDGLSNVSPNTLELWVGATEVRMMVICEFLAGGAAVSGHRDFSTGVGVGLTAPTFTAKLLQNPARIVVSNFNIPGHKIKGCSVGIGGDQWGGSYVIDNVEPLVLNMVGKVEWLKKAGYHTNATVSVTCWDATSISSTTDVTLSLLTAGNGGNNNGGGGGGNNNGGGTPPKSVSFTDVPKGHKFYSDIRWLSDSGITTGVKQGNGTLKFLPKDNVSREAMIAFLYRANGVKNYKPKGKSPFTDVKPGDKFYTQIMWAYETKVTTGTKQANGTRVFEPKASITREAMAAFMYRQYGKKIKTGVTSAKFTDIPANHKFGKEIKWMASNKITTGTKQANGTVVFDPKGATSREATAAFLHRAELKK